MGRSNVSDSWADAAKGRSAFENQAAGLFVLGLGPNLQVRQTAQTAATLAALLIVALAPRGP